MKKTLILWTCMIVPGLAFAQHPNNPAPEATPAPQQEQVQAPAAAPEATPLPTPTPEPTPTPSKSKSASKSTKEERLKVTEKGKIQLDYVNAEIADIAQSIGELTKRNFIIDDKVRGTITIISPQPVSIDEAYQAFISALEVKGFAVTRAGNMNKIVPLREMNKLPIPINDSGYAVGGDDAFVTRLVPIKHTKSSEISKALRNLLTKNGDMISYDPTNTLIITDSVSNLRRLVRIIERLDEQGFEENINIVKLKYASAVETSEKIKKLFDIGTTNAPNAAPQPADMGGAYQYISKILPDERTNSLIIVANAEGLKKISDFVKVLDQSLSNQASSGRIHVHYLNYADAKELASTLAGVSAGAAKRNTSTTSRRSGGANQAPQQEATPSAPVVAGLLGGDVEVTADEQTNSLIITASSGDYQSLIPVINKLDTRRPQAFVEAMIMEVDIDKASDVGVAGNLASQYGSSNQVDVFGATTLGTSSSVFLPASPAGLQGLVAGMRAQNIEVPLGGGESLTIPVFGTFFRALQTNGTVNVLSTPNILTRDNMEAEIIVGSKVPFISSQGRDINNQPINQIQREDVALTLRVKPQINSSDEMTLDIFQEIQDVIANSDIFGPTTSKRSTKTTVLVKDRQTVTIGGLINDRVSDQRTKVPLLGDIPLIGWLFRNTSKKKTRVSLMVYLTPTIIRSPEDLENITLQKNYERKQFLRHNRAEEHPGLVDYGLNRNLKAPAQPTPADSPTSGFMSDGKKN